MIRVFCADIDVISLDIWCAQSFWWLLSWYAICSLDDCVRECLLNVLTGRHAISRAALSDRQHNRVEFYRRNKFNSVRSSDLSLAICRWFSVTAYDGPASYLMRAVCNTVQCSYGRAGGKTPAPSLVRCDNECTVSAHCFPSTDCTYGRWWVYLFQFACVFLIGYDLIRFDIVSDGRAVTHAHLHTTIWQTW